jgi:hypothetical protein
MGLGHCYSAPILRPTPRQVNAEGCLCVALIRHRREAAQRVEGIDLYVNSLLMYP